ncbi:MAG: O-methyltransferase [Alphaproteobacteria bacterium]|nr:O-methyltransferase [Alphaproteobacteria bacterium]
MPGPEPAKQPLFHVLEALYLARAVYVVAELGVADHLRTHGPTTAAALAEALGAHPVSLHRVLRALAGFAVFAEDPEGRFHLTPAAVPLESEAPWSIRHWARMAGAPPMMVGVGQALEAVRTGEVAFELAHGESVYDLFARDAVLDDAFVRGMSAFTEQQAAVLVPFLQLGEEEAVCDVAGGRGALVEAMLRAHPRLQATLFDRASGAEAGRARLDAAGVGARAETVAGSFFEAVPPGRDAYTLKHVLRDWDDGDAVRILRTIRAAVPAHGRLLLVDATLDPRNDTDRLVKLMDLEQMWVLGGGLRTRAELERLLVEAGWTLVDLRPTPIVDAVVLEARPA